MKHLLKLMKSIFIILIFSPFIVLAQTEAKGFIVSGKLTGVADGTEIKLIRNGESIEFARTTIQKGSFILKGSVKEPVLCFLFIGDNKPVELYLENSKITVNKAKDQPEKYIINGSATDKDFQKFLKTFLPLFQQLSSLSNSVNTMVPGPDRDSLMSIYTSTQKDIQNQIDKFIAANPHSMVSPFVLNVTSQFYDDPVLLEKRFNQLDAIVRNSDGGQQLAQIIANNKIGAIGTQSLDFIQPDTAGNPVSLSSFHGKYVLVDFWASWCGPCRGENPNVVENFNKFKDKNFTVLGVSLDRPGQKDKWIEAIKKDNLTWTHVSDLQFWNNAAAQLYHIQAIPRNLLLDPDGKIIAKNLRGTALQAKLCEIFGCN
jgi:peroxiredoxin